MSAAVLLAINIILALVVLVYAIVAMNEMDHDTHHGLRIAYGVTFVGALAVIAGPWYGYTRPPGAEVLFNAGFALLLYFDRRRGQLCQRPPGCPLEPPATGASP